MTEQDVGTVYTDEQAGRRASTFGSLAPQVAIGGFDVFRSTMTFVESSEDPTDSVISWIISGSATDYALAPMMLVGDLSIQHDEWFIGCSVVAQLMFADSFQHDFSDHELNRALATDLGGWASNALYDLAAIVARSLIASNNRCEAEVPFLTPEAVVAYSGPDSE